MIQNVNVNAKHVCKTYHTNSTIRIDKLMYFINFTLHSFLVQICYRREKISRH